MGLLVGIINAIYTSTLKISIQRHFTIKLFLNKIKNNNFFRVFEKYISSLIKILHLHFMKISKSQVFRFCNKTNNETMRSGIITEVYLKKKKILHEAFFKFRDRFIITSKKYIRLYHRCKNNIYYRKLSNDLIVISEFNFRFKID